jgi:hypothetical protein
MRRILFVFYVLVDFKSRSSLIYCPIFLREILFSWRGGGGKGGGGVVVDEDGGL